MPSSTISLHVQAPIARLTLSSGDGANAIDHALLADLASACAKLAEQPAVRAVILSANGPAFSRGWDAAAFTEGMAAPVGDDPFGCLAALSKPVICAINGDALSAGLELALACDIRIAAEGAHVALPEVSLGLLPLAGGMQRLARLVGRGNALRMLLTGEPIDAAEALRIGLVGAVVPQDKLIPTAEAVASRIAERGPIAVGYAKEAVLRGLDMPLEQALRFETDLTVILQTTEDRAEGVRAFLEKRRPEFKGR